MKCRVWIVGGLMLAASGLAAAHPISILLRALGK